MMLATTLVCLYGFFKEMRPSEPFLAPYLRTEKNLTQEEVTNQVFPVWTYSYLSALVFVFLLTDYLRYKPVIIFESLTYIGTWLLLLFGQGLQTMQLMQFLYGMATATEIAYYSYIYAVVPADQYRKVTSYTRTAILTGDFVAGALGQILISCKVLTYYQLNIISLSSVCVAFVLSIFLPTAKKSIYFHKDSNASSPRKSVEQYSDGDNSENKRKKDDVTNDAQLDVNPSESQVQVEIHVNDLDNDSNRIQEEADDRHVRDTDSPRLRIGIRSDESAQVGPMETQSKERSHKFKLYKSNCSINCRENLTSLLTDFKACYSNPHLMKWSLWWAFATCGNFLIGNYIQNLWDLINPSYEAEDSVNVYNGAVEAVATLSGALSAFILAFVKFNWTIFGELTLGVVSVLDSCLLLVMSITSNIWIAYAFYVLFRASYQFLITIASFQIAAHLTTERYALVFGCNTLVALALQSLLTVIVVDKHGLDLPANTQFKVYSGYFFIIGGIFMSKAIFTLTSNGWRASCSQRWDTADTDTGNCEEKYLAEEMEKSPSPNTEYEDREEGETTSCSSQTTEDRRPLII
ncbi:thiamine transporter 2-like [Ptychodera flava]|uniref:thiamine transporter 2-like n=1 Tax=Ptychodera flava TaxID=63121 RepID=UPI00396A95A6